VGGSDVVGTVVDGEGAVVASAKVEIAGQLVVTDELGRFIVHHVPETYSAVIIHAPPPKGIPYELQTVEIYDELTTRNPKFRLVDLPRPDTPYQGAIDGSLSGGGGFPMPIGEGFRFAATAINSSGFIDNTTLLYPTTFAFPVLYWTAEPANKYTIGALQWRAGQDGMPTSYEGWATSEIEFPLEPYPEAILDLVLAPVASRTVTGTIAKPTDCILGLQGTVSGIPLFDHAPSTDTFSYLMPEPLSGRTTALTASCRWGTWPHRTASSVSVGLDAENSVDLAVPSPPSLIHPAHEATGVTYDTPFSWDAGDHLLRVIRFEGGGWTIYRYGTGESSTLPDLTRFDISIPPATSVQWQVRSNKFDDSASSTWDDRLGTAIPQYQHFPVRTGQSIFTGDSQTWTFTLAP
jgi:hypothetical protein